MTPRASQSHHEGMLHSMPTRPVSPTLVYAASGALMGAAYLLPGAGGLAWLGTALLAAALQGTVNAPAHALLGVTLSLYGSRLMGFGWTAEMMSELFGLSPLLCWAYAAAYLGLCALPAVLAMGIAYVALSGRLALAWWFPVAYALGELGRLHLVGMTVDDWLMLQWQTQPVLRAVGHLGWWPAFLLCVGACASCGVALAEWRWRPAIPTLAVALVLLALPPLPRGDLSLFNGVAAVHTRSTVALPHRLPPDEALDLVIWPEMVFEFRPLLGEGEGRGAILPALVGGASVTHLVGLETRLPGGLALNQLVGQRGDGTVLRSRAKHMLFPVTERRFLGLGRDRFVRGRTPPRLDLAGRALLPMVCGEYLWPGIISVGVAEGAELLVVASRDNVLTSPAAHRQLLAAQVLRSVQFGLPSVRASYQGQANFIAADGTVLARSEPERSGLLLWSQDAGARAYDLRGEPMHQAPAAPEPAPIAVLYASSAPHYRTRCPEGRCSYHALKDLQCGDTRAETVVVAGHGSPPTYLSHPAEDIAAAVACFQPELVVVDTCYGASAELLGALGKTVDPIVVAVPRLLPDSGFEYDDAFFGPGVSAEERARAVRTRDAGPVLRSRVDTGALVEAMAAVESLSPEALAERLVRRRPAQVGMPFGGLETGVLVSLPDASPVPPGLSGSLRSRLTAPR